MLNLKESVYQNILILHSAESWHCTMVHAATLGIPGSLDSVSKHLDFL